MSDRSEAAGNEAGLRGKIGGYIGSIKNGANDLYNRFAGDARKRPGSCPDCGNQTLRSDQTKSKESASLSLEEEQNSSAGIDQEYEQTYFYCKDQNCDYYTTEDQHTKNIVAGEEQKKSQESQKKEEKIEHSNREVDPGRELSESEARDRDEKGVTRTEGESQEHGKEESRSVEEESIGGLDETMAEAESISTRESR